jgi:hypothetical protein
MIGVRTSYYCCRPDAHGELDNNAIVADSLQIRQRIEQKVCNLGERLYYTTTMP